LPEIDRKQISDEAGVEMNYYMDAARAVGVPVRLDAQNPVVCGRIKRLPAQLPPA
jgi:hypothetical protein